MTQCCAFHRVGGGCSAHPLAARPIRFQAHAKIGWTRTVSNHRGLNADDPLDHRDSRPAGWLFLSSTRKPIGVGPRQVILNQASLMTCPRGSEPKAPTAAGHVGGRSIRPD
jgi:hypothetical protein